MNYENRAQTTALPEELQFNLSDFALFLSVMKNQTAHECVLSIIMGEPDLKLEKIHVEQVVLNKSGKRAIRLDAWAIDTENRRYATEMQNSGTADHIRYTFTEQCEEVADLHLEDGTTKIFLNMSSKNGDPILVSLLQYMRKTTLENPEILVKDERLVTLDTIVTEVRQSEEWEDITMDILTYGIIKGKTEGKIEGILELLKDLGPIPDELKRQIQEQKDPEIIMRWLKAAAKCDSIEAFMQQFSK